eukprot:gene25376-11037_t
MNSFTCRLGPQCFGSERCASAPAIVNRRPSRGRTVCFSALPEQTVSGFIQRAEKKRKDRKAAGEADGEPATMVIDRKQVKFQAGAKGEKLIKEALQEGRPDFALKDYLMLPLDQYSLLDPKWITRDPAMPELFKLMVPLDELVGVNLQPQMNVAQPPSRSVTAGCSGALIWIRKGSVIDRQLSWGLVVVDLAAAEGACQLVHSSATPVVAWLGLGRA